jgi:tripartite-type tricarboxylate transporter receptor subunit TctC
MMLQRLVVLCSMLAAMPAAAQSYPVKPIRLVVPFAPGGPNDFVARILAQKVSDDLKQPIVIDNRAGAGGNIGTELVAKAPRDGYTLCLVGMHFVVNPSLYENVGYDALKDLAPITLAAVSPVIIVAHPSLPARDVRELVQLAKTTQLNYGSPGTGTAGHLAGVLFDMVAGVKMQQIPYKGAAPAVSDLLGGQVKLGFMAFPPATPHVRAGKLHAIAVTTLQRSAALPDVPTVAESGFPGFSVDNMYGVLTTGGTPRVVVERLNREIARTVRMPDVVERLTSQGYELVGDTPEHFAAYLRTELEKWTKVVKVSGLRVE